MSASAGGTQQSSPQQLSFAIHPWLASLDAIAAEHSLQHHDSGVSFSSYVSRASSGSSRSAGSSFASSQHREGSSSTGLTSQSVGSVGSLGSLLIGRHSSGKHASSSGSHHGQQPMVPSPLTTTTASQQAAGSKPAGNSITRNATEEKGADQAGSSDDVQFFDAATSQNQLSSSPSAAMTRSPLAQAAEDEQIPDRRATASTSSLAPPQQGPTDRKHVIESPGITESFDAREDIWADVARRVKPFGDTLRQERLRTSLGKTALAKDCAMLLEFTAQRNEDGPALHDAQIELLRVLANMCIDHDENRSICLSSEAPQACISAIRHVLDSALHDFPLNLITMMRMAMGALNNMQLEHAATRESLRAEPTSIETLLRLATDGRIYKVGDWFRPHDPSINAWEWKRKVSAGNYVTSTAWQLLQDVCAGDEEKSASPAPGLVRQESSDDDDGEKRFDCIVRIGAVKAAAYLVESLEPFAAKAKNRFTSPGPWDEDDVADLIESDANAVQCTAELIESCALDSKEFRIAALNDEALKHGPCSSHSVLEFLLRFLDVGDPPHAWLVEREDSEALPPKPSDPEVAKEALSSFARAKAAIARAIVLIVGEDDNMATLFEGQGNDAQPDGGEKQSWFIESMKEWMTRDSKERDDLVSTAMLAIGNLARKDSHCIALVHTHGFVPSLTAALQPDVDIKVAHAVVCLLKNLAIPPRNKAAIGQSNDLFQRLSPFIGRTTDRVQPMQFAAVGLLKHLCSNCLSNSILLTTKSSIADDLLDLLKRTDDVPTRMEGTRALAATVKSLWSAPLPTSGTDPDAATDTFGRAIVDIGVRHMARRQVCTEPIIMALAEMVRGSTKYPVLVNEGILGLTLLATENSSSFSAAQVVAKSLLADPSVHVKSKKRSGEAAADEAAAELISAAKPHQEASTTPATEPASPGHGADEGNADLLQPHRQTTLDSLASNAASGLPPIRTGADMVGTVLARRDARMPPHFASNACALVQTLIQSKGGAEDVTMRDDNEVSPEANSTNANGHQDYIRTVVKQWLPALQQLSEVGPQETVATAQRVLQNAQTLAA